MVECKQLKKMDILGKSDPFVQILLIPGKHVEMKTKVIKKNLNPVFDEIFKYVVSVLTLATHPLIRAADVIMNE